MVLHLCCKSWGGIKHALCFGVEAVINGSWITAGQYLCAILYDCYRALIEGLYIPSYYFTLWLFCKRLYNF